MKEKKMGYQKGRYRLKVIAAVLGESKSGTPQVEIGVEPLEFLDPETKQWEPAIGSERTVYVSLTDKTMGTAAQPGWALLTLQDLGFVGSDFTRLEPLKGKIREGEMKVEAYEGRDREKWQVYRQRAGTPVYKAATQFKANALSQRYAALTGVSGGDTVGSAPEPSGGGTAVLAPPKKSRKGKAEEPAPAKKDDDIPF